MADEEPLSPDEQELRKYFTAKRNLSRVELELLNVVSVKGNRTDTKEAYGTAVLSHVAHFSDFDSMEVVQLESNVPQEAAKEAVETLQKLVKKIEDAGGIVVELKAGLNEQAREAYKKVKKEYQDKVLEDAVASDPLSHSERGSTVDPDETEEEEEHQGTGGRTSSTRVGSESERDNEDNEVPSQPSEEFKNDMEKYIKVLGYGQRSWKNFDDDFMDYVTTFENVRVKDEIQLKGPGTLDNSMPRKDEDSDKEWDDSCGPERPAKNLRRRLKHKLRTLRWTRDQVMGEETRLPLTSQTIKLQDALLSSDRVMVDSLLWNKDEKCYREVSNTLIFRIPDPTEPRGKPGKPLSDKFVAPGDVLNGLAEQVFIYCSIDDPLKATKRLAALLRRVLNFSDKPSCIRFALKHLQVLQSVLMHAGELKVVCVLVEAMLQRHSQKTRWRRHLETVQRKFLHTKGISREKVRSDDGKEKVRDIIMGSLECAYPDLQLWRCQEAQLLAQVDPENKEAAWSLLKSTAKLEALRDMLKIATTEVATRCYQPRGAWRVEMEVPDTAPTRLRDLWDRLQVEGPYHRCRDAAQMAFNFKGFLPPPVGLNEDLFKFRVTRTEAPWEEQLVAIARDMEGRIPQDDETRKPSEDCPSAGDSENSASVLGIAAF